MKPWMLERRLAPRRRRETAPQRARSGTDDSAAAARCGTAKSPRSAIRRALTARAGPRRTAGSRGLTPRACRSSQNTCAWTLKRNATTGGHRRPATMYWRVLHEGLGVGGVQPPRRQRSSAVAKLCSFFLSALGARRDSGPRNRDRRARWRGGQARRRSFVVVASGTGGQL